MEKPFTDQSLRARALPYYATEMNWSSRLFWSYVYMHVELYRFLIAPLEDRYPVIP